MSFELTAYCDLLSDIKGRIAQAQVKAALSANAEMIYLYWDLGKMIAAKQEREGWGAAVIPRLAVDLKNDFPDSQGYSERNLKRMIRFYREYSFLHPFVPQAVAQLNHAHLHNSPIGTEKAQPSIVKVVTKVPQAVAKLEKSDLSDLQQAVAQLPWGHNVVLWEKVKDLKNRLWYMQQTIENGWSRDVMVTMIKSNAHERQGAATTNFDGVLPPAQSDLAGQVLKSPYLFDFMTLDQPFRERELEIGLIKHLEKFLLELGQGFAFVGRQYKLEAGDQDFFIDLLFYHIKLRCFVVVDLKIGGFKPEYAGKMNFYCNVVDDTLKHDADQPTIGLILCQDKNKVTAEYALHGMTQPIGVSEYELTRALPHEFKSSLPTVAEIEREFGD